MEQSGIPKTSSMPYLLSVPGGQSHDLELNQGAAAPNRLNNKQINRQQKREIGARHRSTMGGLGKRNVSIDEGLRERRNRASDNAFMKRHASDANVATAFRSVEKDTSHLPYLSQPVVGPSTQADTSLNYNNS